MNELLSKVSAQDLEKAILEWLLNNVTSIEDIKTDKLGDENTSSDEITDWIAFYEMVAHLQHLIGIGQVSPVD